MKSRLIIYAAVFGLLSATAYAVDDVFFEDACQQNRIVFAHVNGVQTSRYDAHWQLKYYIKPAVLAEAKALGLDKRMKFEQLYNHSQGLIDFYETFAQRAAESGDLLNNMVEQAWMDAYTNNNNLSKGSWYAEFKNKVFASIEKYIVLNNIGSLALTLDNLKRAKDSLDDPITTQQNYQEHYAILDKYVANKYKIIISSHSQGTLFANVYYKYLKGKGYNDDNVKVIYAAPATQELPPDKAYTLANWDMVIKGLKLVGGSLAPNVNIMPPWGRLIPPSWGRPAGVNGETNFWLGHGMLEIYLNEDLPTREHYLSHVRNALRVTQQKSFGFIRANMDVDGQNPIVRTSRLFVIGPDGSRVANFLLGDDVRQFKGTNPNYIYSYNFTMQDFVSSCYASKYGRAVDNANKFLLTGTYKIGVEHRGWPNNVTVNMYAWDNPFTGDNQYSPLATKSYQFGQASSQTEYTANVTLFEVDVAKDDTGNYTYAIRPVTATDQQNPPPINFTPPGGFLFAAIPPELPPELPPDNTENSGSGSGGTPQGGGSGTNNNPVITTQPPANAAVTAGQTATFTVVATGSGTLSYQWQVSTDAGITWANIVAGGNSSTFTTATTTAMNGYRYRVVVMGSTGSTTSSSTTLSVNAVPIAITIQPADSHAIATESTTPDASFSVVASGGVPPLTYQWQVSTNSTPTWANVTTGTGGNTATYTITPTLAMNGYRYRVLISDSTGRTVTSNAAALYVQTINGGPYTVEGVISGLTTNGLILQLGSEQLAVPANATSFRFTTSIARGAYYNVTVQQQPVNPIGCNVQNGEGTALSNVTDITVSCSIKLGITTQPASVTVAAGQTATFTVAATGSGTLSYQWQVSTNSGTTWANIPGATSSTYTTAATTTAMNGYRYRVVVTNSTGSVTSGSSTLTVNAALDIVITAQPANVTVAAGQTASFTIGATGSGTLSYQWQVSTDSGTTWANIAGGTSSTYITAATTAAMNGSRYRVVVTNSTGSITSNSTTLTVNAGSDIVITTQPANVTVTAGQVAIFTAAATGSGILSYRWQVSTDSGTTWAYIALEGTSAIYTTAATTTAMNGYLYRVVVTNNTGSVTSNSTTLTVNAASDIVITTQPVNGTVAAGQTSSFTVGATGSGILSYQWQMSTDFGTTWANIAGATSSTYTTAATTSAMNGSRYRVIVTNSTGSVTSNAVILYLQTTEEGPHTVEGTITGLTTNGLILQIDYNDQYAGDFKNHEQLVVAANATGFRFTAALAYYANYSVTVKQQPNDPLGCSVENGRGIAVSNVSNIEVNCNTFKTSPVHRRISVAYRRVCAITYSGGVKCWGVGWLGDGQMTQGNYLPVDVLASSDVNGPKLSGIVSVATNDQFSCALTSGGGVKCWGENKVGQLGNGTKTDSATPVDVIGLTSGVSSISIGLWRNKVCAVMTQGGVKCWGAVNSSNNEGTPLPVDFIDQSYNITDVSLEYSNSCSLSRIGEAWCWGNYGYDFKGLRNNIKAVAADSPATCYLTFSGTAECFLNREGSSVGGGLKDVQAISASEGYVCAITTDGGLRCRHVDYSSNDGWPSANVNLPDRVVEVSLGYFLTCALMASGGAKCWSSESNFLWGYGVGYEARRLVDIYGYRWLPPIDNSGTPPTDPTSPVSPGGGGTKYTGHLEFAPNPPRYVCVPNEGVHGAVFCPPPPF